jgi:hypothetical protein
LWAQNYSVCSDLVESSSAVLSPSTDPLIAHHGHVKQKLNVW